MILASEEFFAEGCVDMAKRIKHSYAAFMEASEGMKKGQRSNRCVVTAEARVLKDLRLKKGLSMKALGKKIGCTDSFISHLENGRADLPNGTLIKILDVYEIGLKYFNELVREKEQNPDDLDIVMSLVKKLGPQQLTYVRQVVEDVLKGR